MASCCIKSKNKHNGSHTSYFNLLHITCLAPVHLWASSHSPPTPSTPATLAFSLLLEHTLLIPTLGSALSSTLFSRRFLWLTPTILILAQTSFPCNKLVCTVNHLHPLATLLPLPSHSAVSLHCVLFVTGITQKFSCSWFFMILLSNSPLHASFLSFLFSIFLSHGSSMEAGVCLSCSLLNPCAYNGVSYLLGFSKQIWGKCMNKWMSEWMREWMNERISLSSLFWVRGKAVMCRDGGLPPSLYIFDMGGDCYPSHSSCILCLFLCSSSWHVLSTGEFWR